MRRVSKSPPTRHPGPGDCVPALAARRAIHSRAVLENPPATALLTLRRGCLRGGSGSQCDPRLSRPTQRVVGAPAGKLLIPVEGRVKCTTCGIRTPCRSHFLEATLVTSPGDSEAPSPGGFVVFTLGESACQAFGGSPSPRVATVSDPSGETRVIFTFARPLLGHRDGSLVVAAFRP